MLRKKYFRYSFEKSKIWPILFELLFNNSENTDLASVIRAAYNLHNSRKTDHPDYLFIITDGLFSLSEIKRIISNVSFCMNKGINIVGIGVGIYPCGINKLFPNVLYSKNPYHLIQGIVSCFSGIISGKMERIKSEFNFRFINQDIKDAQENLKNQHFIHEMHQNHQLILQDNKSFLLNDLEYFKF